MTKIDMTDPMLSDPPFAYWNPGDHHAPDKGWWWYGYKRPDDDHGPFDTEIEAKTDMDNHVWDAGQRRWHRITN